MGTIRLLLALASQNGWEIHQMDVKNAFLKGDLQEEIYMHQPQGFVQKNKESYVCKLKESLYGLKQAPQAWYSKLRNFFQNLGFSHCKSDNNLFFKFENDHIVIIVVYVDDLLITSSLSSLILKYKQKLSLT